MEDDDSDYGTFLGGTSSSSHTQGRGDKVHSELEIVRPLDTSRKWLMVAILSILSGVNQGVCYSYAPIASIAETRWQQQLHSTELITVFFVAYIPSSFVGSWLMDKQGLRWGVVVGGALQALGAVIRYAATYASTIETETRVTLLGQVVASVAMPFVVNSPPVLSANWFPPSQRATATSIAVNANALGTALVYLTVPFIVRSGNDMPQWNLYVAIFAVLSWAWAYLFFQSFPSSVAGETDTIVSDVQLQDEYDWKQWIHAFLHKGFWHTVVGFSIAECIVNAMSALLGKFLSSEGFSKVEIGIIGAVFIVSSLVGSQIISGYVDQRRNHQAAFQICLLLTAGFLALFKLTLRLDNAWLTLSTLMVVGSFLGPLQPIVLELGVECAFPTSEATVAALQQLCGNFLSAILVPGMSVLRRTHTDTTGHVPARYFYATPEWIIVFLLLLTFAVFCFFDGEYKRFNHEAIMSPVRTGGSSKPATLGKAPSLLPVTVKLNDAAVSLVSPPPAQAPKGAKKMAQQQQKNKKP